MFWWLVQHPLFKRLVSQTLALGLSYDLRWSIKAVGWSYRTAEKPCPVCHSRRIEVYDETGNRLMVEDREPYDHYPGEVCDCAWRSLKPPLTERGGDNAAWVSQRTVDCITQREADVAAQALRRQPTIKLTRGSAL